MDDNRTDRQADLHQAARGYEQGEAELRTMSVPTPASAHSNIPIHTVVSVLIPVGSRVLWWDKVLVGLGS